MDAFTITSWNNKNPVTVECADRLAAIALAVTRAAAEGSITRLHDDNDPERSILTCYPDGTTGKHWMAEPLDEYGY